MYFVNLDRSLYYADFGEALADAWNASCAHGGLPVEVHEIADDIEVVKLVATVSFRE